MEDFHFGMEAFGDSIVSGEPPHGGDFVSPGVKRIAQLNKLGESGLFQIGDHAQETGCQFCALFLILMFFQQH